MIFHAVWKLNEVYKLMQADNKFNPIVVICLYIAYGQEMMFVELENDKKFCDSKGYNYVLRYDYIEKNGLMSQKK